MKFNVEIFRLVNCQTINKYYFSQFNNSFSFNPYHGPKKPKTVFIFFCYLSLMTSEFSHSLSEFKANLI